MKRSKRLTRREKAAIAGKGPAASSRVSGQPRGYFTFRRKVSGTVDARGRKV